MRAVFFVIVLAVVVLIHVYLWSRLVRAPALPAPWRTVAGVAIIALGLLLPAAFAIRRMSPGGFGTAAYVTAMMWLGMAFLLFLMFAVVDLGNLFAFAGRFGKPLDPSRRLFLARLGAGAVFGGTVLLTIAAVREALSAVRVRSLEVILGRLPRALDGTTVVQLTDLHIGPTLGRTWVEGIVERTNALEPDIIAITGDLVDGSVEDLRHAVEPLSRLKARHGVFFVTGNHEYYAGAAAWVAHLGTLGVKVLRNEHVVVGDGLVVAGVDDWNARGMAPGHGADLDAALAGAPDEHEVLLLAHQPRAIHQAAERGVGLQLSGHTHGGQIWPWKYFVFLQQPYVAGLHRHGETQLFVSNGTGYWGPPMRLGAPAEIVQVTLRNV